MRALDPRHVDESRRATDQRAAGECQLGHALPAALVDRPRAVSRAPAAFDLGTDRRMLLPALEFLERMNVGIGVIQRGDEADSHLAVRLVVQEPAPPAVALR